LISRDKERERQRERDRERQITRDLTHRKKETQAWRKRERGKKKKNIDT